MGRRDEENRVMENRAGESVIGESIGRVARFSVARFYANSLTTKLDSKLHSERLYGRLALFSFRNFYLSISYFIFACALGTSFELA